MAFRVDFNQCLKSVINRNYLVEDLRMMFCVPSIVSIVVIFVPFLCAPLFIDRFCDY